MVTVSAGFRLPGYAVEFLSLKALKVSFPQTSVANDLGKAEPA